MTKHQLAAQVNGAQYRKEDERFSEAESKKAGLVVIFGASDDLLEFRGAIHEELGAWDGTKAYIFKKKGEWVAMDETEFEEYKEKLEDVGMLAGFKYWQVNAEWSPTIKQEGKEDVEASWLITGDTPEQVHFDVMEDGELYCRGLVIDLNELS
jgi:hypothetical protein